MSPRTRRRLGTYSIVAADGGWFGVAVQSHWFNVGAMVPWVEAGIGAVAVQSISDPASGARALELLRAGETADAVLGALLAGDADAAYRQIAIADARGGLVTHTGELCIPEAGHQLGEGYSVQANLMGRPTVWPAMAQAFEGASGNLVERLLVALEAAEAEGGDVRGRQSAALVVVPPRGEEGTFDLRVEDAREPLVELRRLVDLQRAYLELNRGDALMARGDFDAALAVYEHASGMVPDQATDGEAAFWVGVAFVSAGRADDALPYLARAAAIDGRWTELLGRLPRSKMLPDDDALIERLLAAMRR